MIVLPEWSSLGLFVIAALVLLLRRLLDRRSVTAAAAGEPKRLRRAFFDGVIVNVLNPKTGLFFLAFLPQFVTVSRGSVGEQIVWLGVVFVLLGAITDSLYVMTAGSAAQWLRGKPGFLSSERWVSGGLYFRVARFVPDGALRLLYCFLPGRRALVLHGFAKKTRKTPPEDLALARTRKADVTAKEA